MARDRAQPDSQADDLANLGARALLNLLPSDRLADDVAGEIERLLDLLGRVEGFEELLASSALDDRERRELDGRVRRSVQLLGALALAIRDGARGRAGGVEVAVTSAIVLDDRQRRQIADTLGEILGREVVLVEKVDPRVLGGLVVRVGDKVFDASVAAELGRMKKSLAERAREF